jgi:restriction endonuclease
MSAESDIKRIQKLDWAGLRSLWLRIVSGSAPGWRPGKALEHLVLRAFQLDGAIVTWPYGVQMSGAEIEQIDGAIYCGGLSCLLECKDSKNSTNIEPIAKLRNQLLRRPAGVIGIVVSRGGFTEPAETLAQFLSPQTVLLYGGEELDFLLAQEKMVAPLLTKYRYCVERGLRNFNNRVEAIP